MALFSQRIGIRPLEKAIQRESVDDDLRVSLWNVLYLNIWKRWVFYHNGERQKDFRVSNIISTLWIQYFKKSVEQVENSTTDSIINYIESYFFDTQRKWWEIFDFIEFIIKNFYDDKIREQIKKSCNSFLESENSAYRIVGNEIIEITNEQEIKSVESALEIGQKTIKIHLETALRLFSDKSNPEYRNSVKESISAVESACRIITGNEKATLGVALNLLNEKMHPALKDAFNKLYGYTSDKDGIRHALTEDANPIHCSDAKFMLIACSAFINFLFTRAAENNLKLKE